MSGLLNACSQAHASQPQSDPINTDTVAALERLLAAAREGAITGFAFAAMYGQRRYCVDAVGGASDNLTFTRGMLAALDDVLGKRLDGKQSG